MTHATRSPNYYYLPLEDQAIHKSVAAYVERNTAPRKGCDLLYEKKWAILYAAIRNPDPIVPPFL